MSQESPSGRWLPAEHHPEENPLATGAWLTEETDIAAESRMKVTSAAQTSPPARQAPAPTPDYEPILSDPSATYGRRTRAVEAYCRELDPAGPAATAAAEILDSLTGGISDDGVLLQATRTAAAKRLADADNAAACAATPARLAARANGTITRSERAELEDHLASCLVCRAAELRSVRADRAYAAILALKLTTNIPTTTP